MATSAAIQSDTELQLLGVASMVNDLMLESEQVKNNVKVRQQQNDLKKNINSVMVQRSQDYDSKKGLPTAIKQLQMATDKSKNFNKYKYLSDGDFAF